MTGALESINDWRVVTAGLGNRGALRRSKFRIGTDTDGP